MRYRSLAEFRWHGTSFSELTNLLPFDRERAEEVNEKSDVVRFWTLEPAFSRA